jgi:hypothetical protein
VEAKAKLKKYSQPKYKSNLKAYEEVYHIPTPNNQDITTGKTYFENQRNMTKCLKNM